MLNLENITVRYGARAVLNDVTLTLQAGEVLALIGPNGAGKSSLLRVANGMLKPTRGRVTLKENDISRWKPEERARWMAVVPQAVHLPEAFTAQETVLMGRTAYLGWLGHEGQADLAATHSALERTSTLDFANRRVGELSGGEQQRVLIARALAQAAPILLMDEPTAHLDLKHQTNTLTLIRSLAKNEGLAVLIALHDLNLAAHFADRVALLSDGALRAVGTPREVLTAQNLGAAYGLPIHVLPHPIHGVPLILPDGIGQISTKSQIPNNQ